VARNPCPVRRPLLTGTVTFLFTDIEGSTRLLHELGDRYAGVLAEHRRVLREAFAAHGGVEVDTQGDAFFYAFARASDGLAAAQAGQRGLDAGPVRVRMGVHTGEPTVTEEGYVGADVHLAARVMGAGHGGQVVVSATTARAAQRSELVELGEHRLKDIDAPVALFQLGDSSFPPLKTISNTNLPRPASSFVGRERELGEVLAHVARGARLLTLTGPGGSGKTRLALEAAASLVPECKAGVFWVGLASLRDPALVTETIAQTLGAKDGLAERVGEREMALLLDNLEQVIGAAPELSALLSACPNLTLLVTSRELLRVQGEVEYPVPPLAEPEAVALFCERSQLEPSEAIAELCARLDNLPLAVELAAARTKALIPAQILERLSLRLDLLKGGRDADPRQQTLRATIGWSYDLLYDLEKQLFRRLSVFAGGCALEAAEEVVEADLDTLQSLVEKSLLRFTDGRHWMLETIREFATDALAASADADAVSSRHAAYFADRAAASFKAVRAGSAEALASAETEHENYRAALAWSLDRDANLLVTLFRNLYFFWLIRGHGRDALVWAEHALARASDAGEGARQEVAFAASEVFRYVGDIDRAQALKEEVIRLSSAMADDSTTGSALADLANISASRGDLETARAYAERAVELRERLGDPFGIAHAHAALSNIEYRAGRYSRAIELMERCLAVAHELGRREEEAMSHDSLARAWRRQGNRARALSHLRQALEIAVELHDVGVMTEALEELGELMVEVGEWDSAARLWGAAAAARERASFADVIGVAEAERQESVERARLRLGADRFDREWASGGAQPLDDVVELALASLTSHEGP
jgi:predicted ATPase/class 3 adenylate cyclase